MLQINLEVVLSGSINHHYAIAVKVDEVESDDDNKESC